MNFKFNWLKGSISLILGVIGGYFIYMFGIAINFKSETYHNPYVYLIPIVIITILIIYFIWSLIQKK